MTFNPSDLWAVAPEIAVLTVALAVILIELLVTRREGVLQAVAAVGLLAVMAVTVWSLGRPTGAFNGMIARDGVTVFVKVLLAGVALLAVLMSRDYLSTPPLSPPADAGGEGRDKSAPTTPPFSSPSQSRRVDQGNPPLPPPAIAGGVNKGDPPLPPPASRGGEGLRHGEYYGLLLLGTCGMMVLASATDLVTLFLGIETMSLALYVLAGIRPERARSGEAALKYFLLGAFSTGFLLYGMAMIYGTTGGQTNLALIGQAVADFKGDAPVMLYAGVGLLMVGLLFKVAAVPFHFWSPDVYQGAPTPVTAFMSVGPKAAAFVAFIRLFGWALPDLADIWGPALWMVAAVTMTLGNVVAIAQHDIKRMLAYSSIAHAGYLLIGVLAAGSYDVRSAATASLLFYMVVYYLMNIGAFTVAILVSRARPNGDYQIDDYQGLGGSHPWLTVAMTLFMVSLAGIPPTAGFFGKLYLFSAGVKAGLVTLVVIAVLNSVVSVYYYLRIVVYMLMRPQSAPLKVRIAPAMAVVVLVCVAGVVKFGLLPGDMMGWARDSAENIAQPTPQVVVTQPEQSSPGDRVDPS